MPDDGARISWGEVAYLLHRANRGVARWGSRGARKLGLPRGLGRFHRRLDVSLANAALQERVERETSGPGGGRLEAFERTVERVYREVGTSGDYVEFGVYYGRTMVRTYRALSRLGLETAVRCIGFDSFEGMPKEARSEAGPWLPGQYRSDKEFALSYLADAGVDLSRIQLVQGWFVDTLNPETARSVGLERISVAMLDCDIYSSTRLALDFCGPLLTDVAFLFFDDYRANGVPSGDGQVRAFTEFLEERPHLSASHYGSYSSDSAVFRVGPAPAS